MNFKYYVGTIDEVLQVDSEIPEFDLKTSREKLVSRLAEKRYLALIASHKGSPVAYKLGYESTPEEFYSWLGGVKPEYRKLGIATTLRKKQEAWAVENGYRKIGVKSMNRYPAMLRLLISAGYQISGYEDNGSPVSSKIEFTKCL